MYRACKARTIHRICDTFSMKHLSLILILGFSTLSTQTIACRCRTLTVQEDFENSHNIMEVTIVKLLKEKRNGHRIYLAEVNRQYKGSVLSNKIKIEVGTSTCDFYFRARKSYLFYGFEDKNNFYTTSQCHRTREMDVASEDIKILNELIRN